MSDYTFSQIRPSDKRAVAQMETLLKQEGIERDKNLDYSVGLFDEDYNLVATGSCFSNTLRCMAVSSLHQGEGLMNEVVSHLMDYQYSRGITRLFLYTKCDTAKFFGDLGFYEITRVDNRVVFMENRRNGFSDYLEQLKNEGAHTDTPGEKIGAVIMNANPFTLGHRYLLEQAAAQVDVLHVFIVSEDVSLIPLAIRERLIKEGSKDLSNLIYHQTGPYMISNATFPSYFLKDAETVIESHAKLDIHVFLKIAAALHITHRFVGEEPFSEVTGIYNKIMTEDLEKAGLICTIIPRKEDKDGAISASQVRTLIHNGDIANIKGKVPACTYAFFTSPEASFVIERIRRAGDVWHY